MASSMCWLGAAAVGVVMAVASVGWGDDGQGLGAWPAAVPGFVAPAAGEHPRLLFRKGDLPAMRARARTPQGQAILARLRFLLDGKEGDGLPTAYNTNKPVNIGAKGSRQLPVGAFTMGHPAGYAFLYRITGEQKYADLAKQALIKFLEGQSDRDERYTWTSPGAGLRTGMMMTAVALAYDLGYDGWDDAFRQRVVKEIQDYRHVCVASGGWEGGKSGIDLAHIANPYYPPGSNHYGALVGGAATAILAIKGDAGAEDAKLSKLLGDVEKNIVKVLTAGFGDHGFFAEGPGPSHMAANTSLTTALQTMKVAGGKDFITPRPNGAWLTLRWAFEIMPGADGKPYYPCRSPSSYGTEHVARAGTSDGGEFCQGFGAIPEAMRPALLWTYVNFVEPSEAKEYGAHLPRGEKSYDALVYPHRAVLAFVNWPVDVQPRNPGELLGHSYRDSIHGYMAFRQGWKDGDDILVTAYLKSGPNGFIKNNDVSVKVWGLGVQTTLPGVTGKCTVYEVKPDGSGVLATEGGVSLAVDFSGVSGAPALIALAGPALKGGGGEVKAKQGGATAKTTALTAGKQAFLVMTLQKGAAPEVKAVGEEITAGRQTMRFDGTRIVVGR